MERVVKIEWFPVDFGDMPSSPGTYLVAFSDGTVESYPMDENDITSGVIHAGHSTGLYWAMSIPHPTED